MSESKTSIEVAELAKVYRLGLKEDTQDNLVMAMWSALRSPVDNFRKYRSLYNFKDIADSGSREDTDDILWALKSVSFEAKQGDIIGIIGTNGAGKSTLLKILSRITPPTSGVAKIRGRVSSLLEVGTGFHPELSGRENIYLNGTILGMRKVEVDRKFEEIVEFSEVNKFLDTPVKRYSSGMRVRLAFSVAAHLEPEILIIDEVLAVGDAAFQRKCLDKMEDVGGEGRTVIFVSHSMPSITRLCTRAILLDKGTVLMDDTPHKVVSSYLQAGTGSTASKEWQEADAPGGKVAWLKAVRVLSREGKVSENINIDENITVEIEYVVKAGGSLLLPHFHFRSDEGVLIFIGLDQDLSWRGKPRPPGKYTSRAIIPGNLLSEGIFYISPALITLEPDERQFYERDVIAFHVTDVAEDSGSRSGYSKSIEGLIRPKLDWQTIVE